MASNSACRPTKRVSCTGRERLETRPGGPGTHELKDLHGMRQPLDRDRTKRFDLDQAFGEPEGLRRQQNASRGGELLHARRQVRRLANGRVVHMQVVADGPHHDLAGIEADPDLDLDPVGMADFVTVASNRLLHGQGRIAGPHGMVFMRNRRAKQGHDAIAHHLVDRAFVAVDGRHHALQHRVEELPGFLGIAVGQQLHGALQVSKQHGDLLALAFEGSFGVQDFLSEVRGGVAEWRLGGWRK